MKIWAKWLLGLWFALGGLSYLPAQISYTVTPHVNVGNPGNLNQEFDYANGNWNILLPMMLNANQWSGVANIPFYFEYFGRPVSGFKVSANGLMTFKTSTTKLPNNNSNLPTSLLPDSTIACYWEQFTVAPPTGTNDFVHTKTFGSAPNRQFWIRWSSFEWGVSNFNFVAVVLEETSNKIYLVDLYGSGLSSSLTTTVGVQASSTFGVSAGGNSIPLSGAGSSFADNSYYEFSPYEIEPYDMHPTAILSPQEIGCGMSQEAIEISLTNVGLFPATGMRAKFRVDQGPFISPETIPGTLNPRDTLRYTFAALADLSATGEHTIEVVVTVNGDNNNTNDTLRKSLTNVLLVNSYPYLEDFEGGTGGWTPGGLNSTWAHGTPLNLTINGAASGYKAWATNLYGNYNNNENSWVISPCFDFSSVPANTMLAMKVWWESEHSWDGAVIQYALDGGSSWFNLGQVGDPTNWFNDHSINGSPGGQQRGWTGRQETSNGSGGWVQATHPLGPALVGQPSVRFRVAFGADGSQNDDGFAFDDFIIAVPPPVDLGNNGFYCEGDILDAGPGASSYLWSNGATSRTISLFNLTGSFFIDSVITVAITDQRGLVGRDTLLASMSKPMEVVIDSVRHVSCSGQASGAIFLSMSGGSGPYDYTWNHGASGEDLTGLAAGVYAGRVEDDHGCRIDMPNITVQENSELSLSGIVTDIVCPGDSTGSVNLNVTGGAGNFSYAWSHGATTQDVHHLPAGSYLVSVTDEGGCGRTDTFLVSEPTALSWDFVTYQDPSCPWASDGLLDLAISGGTSPYTFQWGHGVNTARAENLAPGSYYLDFMDVNGCQAVTDTFLLTYADTLPRAGFSFREEWGLVITEDSAAGAHEYFWDFGDGKGTSTEANPRYPYEDNGVFVITQVVTNPCGTDTARDTVEMIFASQELDEQLALQLAPNPNDGAFTLTALGQSLQGVHLRLLNLAGQQLWQASLPALPAGAPYRVQLQPRPAQGLYWLELRSDQGVIHRQIAIE